jgi:predicted dehydrogenase
MSEAMFFRIEEPEMLRCLLFATLLSLAWCAMNDEHATAQSPPPCETAEQPAAPRAIIKAGMIGLDTSHCIAFAKALNDPKATGDLADVDVVAAFPGGSDDIPASRDRLAGYTKQIREMGIEIVDSVDALVAKVDVVLLESVDGRPHLAQAKPVIAAGKPLFIDKPVAGSLKDAVEIYKLSEKHKAPVFSSSSLRFSPGIAGMRKEARIGDVTGCVTWGPCEIEPHHPDLFWYGVHGVEMLYTIMGTGCTSVTRTHTAGTDVVTGAWQDGRIGTYRGLRAGKAEFGGTVFGKKGIAPAGPYVGYQPLVAEIARFFRTKEPPVSAAETIELFAFMEAADESKRQGGKPVLLADVLRAAGWEHKADGNAAAAK